MAQTPPVFRHIHEMRQALTPFRKAAQTIALVPTMGALHKGHLALVREAKKVADHVVVSIFVNPTQFAPGEDFDAYPRTEETDLEKLATLGITGAFIPNASEMYPEGFATSISLAGPAQGLETDHRPHFFSGVAVVVSKLLLAALPDFALFGEKDFQQLRVIERMAQDLNIPCKIIGSPTIREEDGLALSSRNTYLSLEERQRALALPKALQSAQTALSRGESWGSIQEAAITSLEENGFRVDYFEIKDSISLAEPIRGRPCRILAAAWQGKTRLIDNCPAELT
ncbi:pantoate--beta-alanine ligase [Flexibacterium corallicola]|uniref:pantoate--beta-alanine ligase n=1 Tax=Flexibacterium corallicola TaxID=3037259 RepID=UPI00286EE7C9|nr:pantoate--beta-alanine ligase [Pseudovibrio sp. M1P-2-3]